MFLGSRVYNELFSVKQRKTTGQNYRPFILQKGLFRDSAVYFRRSKEVIRCYNDTAVAWLTDGHATQRVNKSKARREYQSKGYMQYV